MSLHGSYQPGIKAIGQYYERRGMLPVDNLTQARAVTSTTACHSCRFYSIPVYTHVLILRDNKPVNNALQIQRIPFYPVGYFEHNINFRLLPPRKRTGCLSRKRTGCFFHGQKSIYFPLFKMSRRRWHKRPVGSKEFTDQPVGRRWALPDYQ